MSHTCANESKRVSGYNRGKRRQTVASIFLLLLPHRIAEVPPGRYWLRVLASDYVNASGQHFGDPGRNISIAGGESLEDVDVDMVPSSSI